MEIIKLKRRCGKTTQALKILMEEENNIMFINRDLMKEYEFSESDKSIKKRIFTTENFKERSRGLLIENVIIDDADLLPTSELLEMVKYFTETPFAGKICKLIITTSI